MPFAKRLTWCKSMRGLKEKRKRKEGRYDINTQWKEVITIAFAKEEAFGIVGKSSATAELVYTSGSPYYPDWKITDGCSVYYVNQQGELFDADADCDGCLISEGDCKDNNAAVYPGATEVCDGVDFIGFYGVLLEFEKRMSVNMGSDYGGS